MFCCTNVASRAIKGSFVAANGAVWLVTCAPMSSMNEVKQALDTHSNKESDMLMAGLNDFYDQAPMSRKPTKSNMSVVKEVSGFTYKGGEVPMDARANEGQYTATISTNTAVTVEQARVCLCCPVWNA